MLHANLRCMCHFLGSNVRSVLQQGRGLAIQCRACGCVAKWGTHAAAPKVPVGLVCRVSAMLANSPRN